MGRPNPSSTLPINPGPTATRAASRRATMRLPNSIPPVSSRGIDSTRPSRKPITWLRNVCPPEVEISQKSPIAATGPADSISRPAISTTSPTCNTGSRSSRAAREELRMPGMSFLGQTVGQPPPDLGELCFERGVQVAARRFDQYGAGFQSSVGDHCEAAAALAREGLPNTRLQLRMDANAADLLPRQF